MLQRMAEPALIEELRRLVDEPTEANYTDAVLSVRIDGASSLLQLGSAIWREKAAATAGLIDVKEGSSDRKLSQLHKHALDMAAGLASSDPDPVTPAKRPARTRPIVRP